MRADLKHNQSSGLKMDGYSDYSEYKNSGHEWLGKIPSHWTTIRANSKFDTNLHGCTPKNRDEEKVEHYSLPNIHEYGGAKLEETDDIASKKQIVTGKEILISKLNPDNGIVVIPENSNRLSICSTEFVPLTTEDQVWRRFGYYYFNSSFVQQYLQTEAKSVTHSHKRVKPRIITKIEFPDPSRKEKKAIVNFLDQETEKIDQLIEQKERLIQLLEEKRESLITRAVTKGLDPDAEMNDSGVAWLGDIPSQWEVNKLRQISNIKPSNVDKKEKDGEEPIELCNYIEVYNEKVITSEVEFMEATAKPKEKRKFKLQKGDVIITKDSEDWKDIAVPTYIAEDFENVLCGYHLAKIEPRKNKLRGKFLYYSLASEAVSHFFKFESKGVTRFGLSTRSIKEGPIPTPPVSEQAEIVEFLDRETKKIDSFVEKIEKSIEVLKEYRTSLISAAVTGKIDVRDEVSVE